MRITRHDLFPHVSKNEKLYYMKKIITAELPAYTTISNIGISDRKMASNSGPKVFSNTLIYMSFKLHFVG